MDNVTSINRNLPHINAMAVCLHKKFDGINYTPCLKTWIATFPVGTNVFRLECPLCGAQNSFVSVLPEGMKNG